MRLLARQHGWLHRVRRAVRLDRIRSNRTISMTSAMVYSDDPSTAEKPEISHHFEALTMVKVCGLVAYLPNLRMVQSTVRWRTKGS